MQTRYAQEIAKIKKKDGIVAICVFFGFLLLSNGFPLLMGMIPMSNIVRTRLLLVWLALLAVFVCIIVKARKQKLSSIGFHKENLGKGIGVALLFSLIPITFTAIIPGMLHGFFELDLGWLMLTLISTFIFAAHEDVIFVGFIQTRLYGFFKTHFVAILVGSLFFAFVHLPPWIYMGRLDVNQPLEILFQFVRWSAMHFVMVAIFRKYHSIVPVFIFHTINNLSNVFSYSDMTLANIAIIVKVLAACFLYWQTHKADKKALSQ